MARPERDDRPPTCTHSAQGVHMMFEGMPDRLWKEGEKRSSKMVFIGRCVRVARCSLRSWC